MSASSTTRISSSSPCRRTDLMAQEIYFYFRRWNVPDGAIVGCMIFDLSKPRQVCEQSPLYLRTAGAVIATTRPFEAATYPQFLFDNPVRPAAYIEAEYRPPHDRTSAADLYECV